MTSKVTYRRFSFVLKNAISFTPVLLTHSEILNKEVNVLRIFRFYLMKKNKDNKVKTSKNIQLITINHTS